MILSPTSPEGGIWSVRVFRDTLGDCTNGGATSKAGSFILVPEGVAFQSSEPILRLNRRMIGGREYLRAIPDGETRHVMFGGNFVWSTDSRFRRQVSEYPIPVHDRVEG